MTKSWDDFDSPGQALKSFLQSKNWTQDDFSYIMSISAKHANELINDKKSISIDKARGLANAFDGWSAQDWMNLSSKFQLQKEAKDEKVDLVKIRAALSEYMPLNELAKKGWIKYKNARQLENQVKSFWNVPIDQPLDLSFLDERASNLQYKTSIAHNEKFNELHAKIWAQMALNHANKSKVSKYDKEGLKELMTELHNYTTAPNGVKKFINDLESIGVKFVYLSHLSKTYLDGAAISSEEGPVVALTGRYDRVDNFWFTLAHELSHVLLHLSEDSNSIFFDDSTNYGDSEVEVQANRSAEEVLMLPEVLTFLSNHLNYITVDKIHDCSNQLELHPSIIVGMLANQGYIAFSNMHKFKEPIRTKIPQKAIAD